MFKFLAPIVGFALLHIPAFAADCEVTIMSDDKMQFSTKEVAVPATCKQFKVTLKHTGKLKKELMGHNWALFATADKADVLKNAEKAGPATGYSPSGAKVLAKTDTIGGGETTSTSFETSVLKKGGDYTFACTFPGHSGLMIGKFVFK